MLNTKNTFYIHILLEIVFVCVGVVWFNNYRKATVEQINQMQSQIEDQNQRIKKLERMVQKLSTPAPAQLSAGMPMGMPTGMSAGFNPFTMMGMDYTTPVQPPVQPQGQRQSSKPQVNHTPKPKPKPQPVNLPKPTIEIIERPTPPTPPTPPKPITKEPVVPELDESNLDESNLDESDLDELIKEELAELVDLGDSSSSTKPSVHFAEPIAESIEELSTEDSLKKKA
jgi:hypothetical protein